MIPRPHLPVVALVLTAVAGCSSGLDGLVDGPLLTSVGTSDDGMTAEVMGTLGYEDDCLLLDGQPVVWPEGTRWDSDSRSLKLPGTDADVALGVVLTGGGGYLSLLAVKDMFGDEVADSAEPCLGSTAEVVVFNPGREVRVGG